MTDTHDDTVKAWPRAGSLAPPSRKFLAGCREPGEADRARDAYGSRAALSQRMARIYERAATTQVQRDWLVDRSDHYFLYSRYYVIDGYAADRSAMTVIEQQIAEAERRLAAARVLEDA